MSEKLYAAMFRIEPRSKFLGFPLRYELEIFIDTSLPEGRKISFKSPHEDLKRMGFKEIVPKMSIAEYADLLQQKYSGFFALKRDHINMLVYHGDTLDNAIRLMQEEEFTFG